MNLPESVFILESIDIERFLQKCGWKYHSFVRILAMLLDEFCNFVHGMWNLVR